MRIKYRDETFVFNKKESSEAVRLCTEFLNNMKEQCEKKDIRTFYVMLLLVMHDLVERAIDYIGIDGIMAMFMKRVRIERNSDGSEEEETPDEEQPPITTETSSEVIIKE